jgi:hypothetical protein
MLDGEAGIEPRRPFTECGRLRANRSWHAIHNTINLQMVSMVSNGPKAQVALQGIECVTGMRHCHSGSFVLQPLGIMVRGHSK